MDRTQHVLDAIDGALEDWTVSGDAMRWTPEPQPVATSRLIVNPTALHIGPADTPVHQLLARSMWGTPSMLNPEQAQRLLASLGQAMQPVMEAAQRMAEGMARTAEEFTPLLAQMMRPEAEPRPEPEDPRERALRLRQQRHTGPSTDLTRQRRPRLHLG